MQQITGFFVNINDYYKERKVNRQGGCLTGLFKLLMLDVVFDWLQKRFSFRRGASCSGCGCGFILLIIFVALTCQVLFDTNWLQLGF